jgi:hypothetical protein
MLCCGLEAFPIYDKEPRETTKGDIMENKLTLALEGLNKAQGEVCAAVTERATELGLTDIMVGSKSEYDDNNYYTQYFLERVFDCKDMELSSYDIDEGIHLVVEFLGTLAPRNSTDFLANGLKLADVLESKQDDIEEFTESFEYSHDVVEMVVEMIKKGVPLDKIDECGEFLSDLVNLDQSCIPSSMTY